MEEAQAQKPIDIRQVLRPIKARLWLIIAVTAIVTGFVYHHYSSQPPQFRASTSLYVGPTDPTQLVSPEATDRALADLATLVQTPQTASLVARDLHLTPAQIGLLGGVSASAASGSDFITVTSVAGSGQAAAAVANAYADAFVANQTTAIHQLAASSIAHINRQLAALPDTVANSTQRGQLSAQLSSDQYLESLAGTGLRHVNPAVPPAVPFAPNPKKNAIFAFVLALMVSVAGVYGLQRLDRRIHSVGDLEELYGYPTLVSLPRSRNPSPNEDGEALLPDDLRESFRKLCLSLQLSILNDGPKTLMVTSAQPREGKSTVTRNLALAFREAGLRVCVVDADLRRPTLSRLFELDPVPGLTDVVVGDEKLTAALRIVPVGVPGLRTLARLQDPSDEGPKPSSGSLVVLPAGPEPANPAVILGSGPMREILSMLGEDFDIVLIDTSPLLAVSDAVPLLTLADGVMIVSRLSLSTTDAAGKLVEEIRRVPGTNLLGVVANDVHGRGVGYHDYSYGYSYDRDRARA